MSSMVFFKKLLLVLVLVPLLAQTHLSVSAQTRTAIGNGNRAATAGRRTLTPDSSPGMVTVQGRYRWQVDLPLLGFFDAHVNGRTLVRGEDYNILAGETVLQLSDRYINSLAPGEYRLHLEFIAADVYVEFAVGSVYYDDDDDDVDEPVPLHLQVRAEVTPVTPAAPNDNPSTGSHPAVWALMEYDMGHGVLQAGLLVLALAILGAGVWAFVPRKSDEYIPKV